MVKNWHEIYDIREGKFICDFRLINTESDTLGDTYPDIEKSYVNLAKHTSFCEIISTVIHEDLHIAILRENLNEDIEHKLIKMLMWAVDDMIL